MGQVPLYTLLSIGFVKSAAFLTPVNMEIRIKLHIFLLSKNTFVRINEELAAVVEGDLLAGLWPRLGGGAGSAGDKADLDGSAGVGRLVGVTHPVGSGVLGKRHQLQI